MDISSSATDHGPFLKDFLFAVNGWEQMRKGRPITLKAAQVVYSFMSGNGAPMLRAEKKKKKGARRSAIYYRAASKGAWTSYR